MPRYRSFACTALRLEAASSQSELIAGTGIALLAGLHTVDEARAALQIMQANVAKAGGQISIGLTVFPPYANGLFKNGCCSGPFSYQNAGDWPWFGARIVQGLAKLGLVDEAKAALRPMIDTVCQYQDFNECARLFLLLCGLLPDSFWRRRLVLPFSCTGGTTSIMYPAAARSSMARRA
jgi:hypothetical protein